VFAKRTKERERERKLYHSARVLCTARDGYAREIDVAKRYRTCVDMSCRRNAYLCCFLYGPYKTHRCRLPTVGVRIETISACTGIPIVVEHIFCDLIAILKFRLARLLHIWVLHVPDNVFLKSLPISAVVKWVYTIV